LDVVQRVWGVNRKANQNDMGIRVAERSETVIVLLARSIPQRQFDVLAVNFNVGDIILEDSRDVDLKFPSAKLMST
jgi:hypothetical protein